MRSLPTRCFIFILCFTKRPCRCYRIIISAFIKFQTNHDTTFWLYCPRNKVVFPARSIHIIDGVQIVQNKYYKRLRVCDSRRLRISFPWHSSQCVICLYHQYNRPRLVQLERGGVFRPHLIPTGRFSSASRRILTAFCSLNPSLAHPTATHLSLPASRRQ